VVRLVRLSPVADGSCVCTFCFGNDSADSLSELRAEVAVPRYLVATLGKPSAEHLPPEPIPGFGPTLPPITQSLRLVQPLGPPFKPLKLKLKLTYARGGVAETQTVTVGPEAFE